MTEGTVNGAIVPLSSLTGPARMNLRKLKRRLKHIDTKIGGGLLVRFSDNGKLFADMAMLKRHIPSLLEGDAEDPVVTLLREVRKLSDEVRYLREEQAILRDAIAG